MVYDFLNLDHQDDKINQATPGDKNISKFMVIWTSIQILMAIVIITNATIITTIL